ncbi:MAG: rod shape-determining protein MreD [Bacteroidales bacterium]
MRTLLQYLFLAVLILMVQVLILNNIHLGGFATPFLYIWLILKLPNDLSRPLTITIGFFMGLIVDIFSNTPGMHALATSFLAYMKEPLMVLYVPREDLKGGVASMKLMGVGAYLRYVISAVVLYCSLLYVIEAFSFFNWWILLIKIVSSSIFTFLLIIGVESLKPVAK